VGRARPPTERPLGATAAAVLLTRHTNLIFLLMLPLYGVTSCWQFGGSYGHRGFTDGLALFAVFLAAFFTWTAERQPRVRNVAIAATLAVLLSVTQMVQYWRGILPIANTTWEQYRTLFLSFH
jgi:membrane-bound metal-dependent hydrolase YbcI (DUF457 family)